MLIEATTSIMAPHIEGVFEVFKRNYKPQSEWVSVDDDNLIKNTYYLIECHGGEWVPFLLNIDNKWVVNSSFLPTEVMNGLRKVILPTPPKE